MNAAMTNPQFFAQLIKELWRADSMIHPRNFRLPKRPDTAKVIERQGSLTESRNLFDTRWRYVCRLFLVRHRNGASAKGKMTTSRDDLLLKLKAFYESTQFQHKVSFWACVAAATIGLIVVVLALLIYLHDSARLNEAVILGVAGVLSEFISAVFLYLHNKNIVQVNAGFEKLIKLQDTTQAIELVERMDKKNHDYMYMSIINVLILRNEPQKELNADTIRALREGARSERPNASLTSGG